MDLSSNGNQPMQSYNHNLIITYNGEIYNHYKIRKELNGFVEVEIPYDFEKGCHIKYITFIFYIYYLNNHK